MKNLEAPSLAPIHPVTKAGLKVLVIYNYTRHLHRLHDMIRLLLPGADCDVVDRMHVRKSNWRKYDIIFLTGGNGRHYVLDKDKLIGQREIIRESKKPLIGICLGAELMAHTLGGELEVMQRVRRWHTPLMLTSAGVHRLGAAMPYEIKVYESHKLKISKLSPSLEALAISKDGVEVFRHRRRPIWGMQFHPEVVKRYDHGLRLVAAALADELSQI